MFKIFNNLFDGNQKQLDQFKAAVATINDLEIKVKKLKDNQIKTEVNKFKKQLSQGKTLDDILPDI